MNKNIKSRKYPAPQISDTKIISKEILRNTNIEEIKSLKENILNNENKQVSSIIKIMEKKYNVKFGCRDEQKMEHALGDYSEASTHLFLLESWKVSEQMDIKWIHPDTGTAPKRGIDITAFSDKNSISGIEGIIIFEVKGAMTESSLESQIKKIKKYINRSKNQINKEIQELLQILNNLGDKLPNEIFKSIEKETPSIRLAGSLVTDLKFKDHKYITNFLKSFNQKKDGLPKGLIILYSQDIRKEVQRFNKEV
ncbi:MAG: hypothetical protein INQ03_02275 [Candidatus Heimdallarchaeota archaeon]|nr:hypothetical protein [Candidatus Heimdallarchaeota archaeon]